MSAAAIGGASAVNTASAGDPYAGMTSGDFMKVLLSELQHQDPTSPTDTTKIMQQLSSLRNIESQLSLQDSLKSLVGQNQVAQASSMIGKLVQGMDANGNKMVGKVTAVRVVDGNAQLELDTGQMLDMSNVTLISEPAGA